ncbi:MAG TPA: cellulose biosynthesis protein BcsS [Xanthobacteraceae bacterium]|jgi:hypothetical protein|nr:cellulose biosynthesis protein BcsS [Xanthobacteraceae bacterium]
MIRGAARIVALAAVLICPALPFHLHADELVAPVPSRAFVFGGVDASRNSTFAWAGATAIPFGTLVEDGLRLRAMGGFGGYTYRTSATPGGRNSGTISSGELMAGYHKSFGATVVTGYLGLDVKRYSLQDADPANQETGTHAGIKAAIELYTRTAASWFMTAYGNVSSVFGNYSARAALHHEIAPGFALGVEGALIGDRRYDEQRAGLVATLTLPKSSLTMAGGVATSADNGTGAYTTISLYAPF